MEHCNVNTSELSQYQIEQQEIADKFLEDYFFKNFRAETEDPIMRNIEIIVSPRCNLGCKYCYVHKYRKEIFDENIFNEDCTIKNLKLLLRWLEKKEYNPDIEIFSGELFAQKIGYKVMETIIEHMQRISPALRCKSITIPTNFTFVCSDEATAKVEKIRKDLKELGIQLFLSASFDGKYMEQNRPYLHNLDLEIAEKNSRDDNYYDKAFKYIAESGSGIHPMIYSKGIKDWKKNFLWFQEKMAKYGIHWENIYLLQVRNQEWTQKEVFDLQDFIRFLFEFIWEKVGEEPELLKDFLFFGTGFNLLSEPISRIGRGLTCGIQSQFTVRLSDLMMYPCHRLGYEGFWFGQLIEDEKDILRFETKNTELLIATYSTHKDSLPYCSSCPIQSCCTGPCLGAQYESNKNLFAPIPSVCIVAHAITTTVVECLLRYHAYYLVYKDLSKQQQIAFNFVKKEIEKHYDF